MFVARGGQKSSPAMHIGTGELLLIGFIIVAVFSASRMGQLGNALGKFVYSFKKASRGEDFVDVKAGKPAAFKDARKAPVDAELVDDDKKH